VGRVAQSTYPGQYYKEELMTPAEQSWNRVLSGTNQVGNRQAALAMTESDVATVLAFGMKMMRAFHEKSADVRAKALRMYSLIHDGITRVDG
jgi:hypothetical protein